MNNKCSRRAFLGKLGKGVVVAGAAAAIVSMPKNAKAGDFIINGECVACGICVPECSVDAIEYVGGQQGYQIDQDLCTSCGTCFEVDCPTKAIMLNPF